MSEKMPRSGAIEGHVGNSRSLEQRIQYDDRASSSAFRSLVSEIMDWSGAPGSKRHELECLLSRYMKQEGGFASSEEMLPYSEKRNSGSQINEIGPRSLQLKFLNKVGESTISTGVPIKGENCQPLKVALVDSQSGDLVKVGCEASVRVEIVALNPDFGGCLKDSWTPEEFKNDIVTKEGNKRLLSGNVVLDLKEGIGYAGIFQFSHTKHWTQKRAYRLGAVVMDDCFQAKIREGFTDSFFVKDHRLDLNTKHHPPNLDDEVWRLDGISRDGAFHKRLRDKEVNINTVEDLLKKLNTDPKKLRNILGKNMSAKMWETLEKHARECIVDKKPYLYSPSECVQETSILFNMVGQVIGLISKSQYVSFELLSEPDKDHAMNLVMSAFQQWDKVVPLDDEASFSKFLGPIENVSHIMESLSSNILIPSKRYELDLPQPTTSFEDKVSVFEESPVASNIIHPPKSPIMESSSGSNKMIIFPKYCELGSPSQNVTIVPPISLVSTATMALISQENSELDFPDEDTILFGQPQGPSNVNYSPKSPIKENWSFLNEHDFSLAFVPSQEISPASDSLWDMSDCNDCYPQFSDVANTDHRHVRRLSYSSQMTNSDNWEIVSMTQSVEGENQDISLQFSVDDVPLDTMELSNNRKNDANNDRKRYLRDKAKKKWRVLYSVIKLLFVSRKVEHMQIKLSSSYQDLQALDIFNESKSYQVFEALNIVNENKSYQVFDSQAPVLSRNLKMNSEALHSGVNDILLARSKSVATKKYKWKREKAQRRWTKLYSVMKWFLVQRDVKKRASSAMTVRSPSSSSSLDQQNSANFACPFVQDEFLQLFDTICSLQPHDHITVNKLARRKNIAERSCAKKKWRMLFSIVKWLLVRKSSARVKR